MLPKISVITVVYNAVATLEETILSVINQDFEDFEFIIIDGGSTDGTIEIIKKYQDKITLWISEPDKGIYDAMNKGIKIAKGDYVYFLGGDDLLYSNSVLNNICSKLIDKNKIYYGNVLFKTRNVIYDGKFSALKIATRNISHQSIFYPREIFNKYSFDTKYKIFADYELNLKLYGNSSYSFVYMPITVALFNDEGSSGSNILDFCFERDRFEIIKNNFPYWIYLYRIYRSKISKTLRLL
ncbi:glycosyltransferase family 2 protein [Flavobacterium sp.]|jgi:glycosyltransferase involved in cell wall biosynthesis|uniref:glycosyltransferase family 2 protein n=1 Tax=Flavobacterium sp. TaxID=239 RepID=UPI0037C1A0C5